MPMLKPIETCRPEIAELCRQFHVHHLHVFGSAARATDFDPERSDVDILVEYRSSYGSPNIDEYLALRDALEGLLGRKVDLVMADAVENPFIRAAIERSRLTLYAA
jgi:uncharacterized protein